MAETDMEVQLKQVLGAIIFAAKQPLTIAQIRRILSDVAVGEVGLPAAFEGLKESEIKASLDALRAEWETRQDGFYLAEVSGGYRFETDAACGPWVRHLLNVGKPARLSRPALETLAIIAYRQPVTRAEIEGVRGVAVDHILRLLMEMQLVRIVGRSDLPGKPLLYGTTAAFLEHFGIKEVSELPGIQELARREKDRTEADAAAAGEPTTEADAPSESEKVPASDDQKSAGGEQENQSSAPEEGKEQ